MPNFCVLGAAELCVLPSCVKQTPAENALLHLLSCVVVPSEFLLAFCHLNHPSSFLAK